MMPKLTSRMKKWYGGVMVASLFTLLVLRYASVKNPIGESYLTSSFPRIQTNDSDPLKWLEAFSPPSAKSPQVAAAAKAIPTELIVAGLFAQRNISSEEKRSLLTWDHLKSLIDHAQALPNGVEAITEAVGVWNNLMASVIASGEGSSVGRPKEKQCPYFLRRTNGEELESDGYKLQFPCGLTQGSSVTIIGTPNGILGEFRIDLRGEPLPGEPDPPIILHYNVRLHGDKLTEDPVIVQNTWTIAHDWGGEERCPSPDSEKDDQDYMCNTIQLDIGTYFPVDELDKCNKIVGSDVQLVPSNSSRRSSVQDGSKPRPYFPFKQGYPFVATFRVGSDGIQMTVDGKHITSFSYREALEPWLVSEVKVSGDLNLISVLASGLPTSEDSEHISDLETLKSPALALRRPLDLVIGVFSTANNFKRRMAVRRTWMQYPAVRSGKVAVRFFVGLHKNKIVNEELWNEAKTYGDVQLMPFVDYYNLITWKTLAICIFGTEVVSAKFVMKTDDDAFVRVDEVLDSLKRINANHGLLYGLINSESQPHRDPNSKWFISPEEWREDKYPPWAHGPGYVISRDIAKSVVKMYIEGSLKMFKLEDVAMGIWIAEMKKNGLQVRYENEARINNEGCKDGYVVAHYQGPREMLCLWQRLRVGSAGARCCGER